MSENPYSDEMMPNHGMGWIKKLSYLLDEQFKLPGTRFRFGMDPIMNFIPFLGDISGFLISAALLLAMARKGASNKLVVLMSLNIVLDTTIGAIPLVGNVFDFFFKSNTRNIKLMNEHYLEGKHQGSGKNILVIVGIVLLILFAILVVALWKITEWFFGLF